MVGGVSAHSRGSLCLLRVSTTTLSLHCIVPPSDMRTMALRASHILHAYVALPMPHALCMLQLASRAACTLHSPKAYTSTERVSLPLGCMASGARCVMVPSACLLK